MSTATTERPSIEATLPPQEGDVPTGGELAVAVPRGVPDWNPLTTSWSTSSRWVASAVYEPLLRTGADGNPEPWLAESVVPDDTATTWTITLRSDVRFHDGGLLTASVVKANLDARTGSPLWEAALAPVGLVTVVDETTVEVAMNQPWGGFAHLLTGPAGWQAAPSSILDGDGEPRTDPLTAPVGTGPFAAIAPTMTAGSGGEGDDAAPSDGSVSLVRHDAYWGGPAPLDAVEVAVIPDGRARADALADGEAHLALLSDPDGLVRFLDRDGFVQVEDLDATEAVVELNTAAAPFDDERLREAVVLATERAPVAELFTEGLGSPAAGPWTDRQAWFDEDTGLPRPDRRGAEELVAQATDGELTVRLLVEPTVEEVQLAQAVAGQWEAVGIDVQLDTRPPQDIARARAAGEFQAALVHDHGIAHPDHLVGRWASDGAAPVGDVASNTTRTRSSELDAALDDLRTATDPAGQSAAAAEAVRALNATRSLVWVQHDVWALVATDRVGGLQSPEQLGFARIDAAPTWASLSLET